MTIHFGWLFAGILAYGIVAVVAFGLSVMAYMDTRESAVFLAFLTALVWPVPLAILLGVGLTRQIRGCFR